MKLFSKKNVQQNVISDGGMAKRTDVFSISVILVSVVVSVLLILLGVSALIFV